MPLTTREICEMYARLQNLEQSPDAFCELLHPEARWITKWWNGNGPIEIAAHLRNTLAHLQTGLTHVELVSGYVLEDGHHVDCTAAVRIAEPEKHDTRAMFQTDGIVITHMFTYAEWLDRTWPHPHRVKHKLAELMVQDIPIAAIPEKPKTLVWPDRDSSSEDTSVLWNDEPLRNIRLDLANALDADPEGAKIPDLGLE